MFPPEVSKAIALLLSHELVQGFCESDAGGLAPINQIVTALSQCIERRRSGILCLPRSECRP